MPKWLDSAIFYEIYPQSFLDTNADGIGDFNGILQKLDYIRDLGCNAIWLNPCFCSPFLDAGYDISDYYTAAPRYGTNADLKNLFEACHSRGIHVLLDLVPGHTSVEHPWFRQSMEAKPNPYTDRYIWTGDVWEAPDDMAFLRGFCPRPAACAVNFFSHQPALNYGYYQPEKPWQQPMTAPGPRATLAEMMNIMRFWLSMGCDGFRVDMAASLVKNDPENKGVMALWREVREFLSAEFPEAALISEWGQPDKSLAGGFHMDFLLPCGSSHYNDLFHCREPYFSSRGRGDASKFVKAYLENYEKTGGKGLMCIPSGNHDMRRMTHYLQGEELKIVFAFLMSMPGAPFIYYGDEIGMRYLPDLASVEGGYERTGSRTPMQWDDTTNSGFSAAPREKLYIPMDTREDRPTVKNQLADGNSLLHEVRRLTAIRQSHEALQSNGGITFLHAAENAYPLAYLRSGKKEHVLVILNPSGQAASFPCAYRPRETVYHLGGQAVFDGKIITAAPCSAGFYVVEAQ